MYIEFLRHASYLFAFWELVAYGRKRRGRKPAYLVLCEQFPSFVRFVLTCMHQRCVSYLDFGSGDDVDLIFRDSVEVGKERAGCGRRIYIECT